MWWEKPTVKEVIYLWNSVVIPTIEYQLQCLVLTDSEAENLNRKIR